MLLKFSTSLDRAPVTVDISQFVVLDAAGTPCIAGGEYGPTGAIRVAHAGEADFNRVLAAFGYMQSGPVRVEHLQVPVPGDQPRIQV